MESFFGLTRHMILQIGRVNSLVAHRAQLLREGNDKGEQGWSVRRRAQEMAEELGGTTEVTRHVQDARQATFEPLDAAAGKPSRIRRGTNVRRPHVLICDSNLPNV